MDFFSSSNGSEVYVLRIQNGLKFFKGVLKNKVNVPSVPQQVSFTVTIDDQDVKYDNVPGNLNIVQKGSDVVALTNDGICEHIKNLIQSSKTELSRKDYHERIISSGEELLEELNPEYAVTKKQEKLIQSLQEQQTFFNERLNSIEGQYNEILKTLKKLGGNK